MYISLIAAGRFQEAYEAILADNPLPSVCARVCHHPCEMRCQAGKWGSPIAVRALKRFAADYAAKAEGKRKKEKGEREEEEGKRQIAEDQSKTSMALFPFSFRLLPSPQPVAVVGSGPAGLMAAYCLARKGYRVTVFEALPVPGGALAACIPEYRLPRAWLDRDIENITRAGVTIRTNTRIGKDLPLEKLLADHKAVFIASGAHRSRKLQIPNEDAEGVIDAMKLLKDVRLGNEVRLGNRVGVIGGGNAAVDAARVAWRTGGCGRVVLIYRRTRAEMPAFHEEVDAMIEEGVEIEFLAAPIKVLAEGGRVTGVECVKMRLGEADGSGRRRPVPVQGSQFVIGLDTLIVAVGEEPDAQSLGGGALQVSRAGTVVVGPETLATGVAGVFAGGDVVTGPNTVIDAMASGKLAAEMIDKYLRGKPLGREYGLTRPTAYLPAVELTEQEIEQAERPATPCLPVCRRQGSFNEVELTWTEAMAIREARRCLRCDLETEDAKRKLSVDSCQLSVDSFQTEKPTADNRQRATGN